MRVPDPPEMEYERAPAPGARRQLGEERGGLEELVEVAHPDHPVLGEEAFDHGVGPGQMAGVRARHPGARLGGPHLERHHRLALGVGGLEGPPELGGVLEPLEVAGDHVGVVVIGEVLDEVRRLEVELVARRHPPAEGHAELGPLHEGTALVPALGHEADAPTPSLRWLGQDLEGVGVGVGAEDPDPVAAGHLAHLALGRGAGFAHLAEAGGEDEDVGHAVLAALLHRLRHELGPHVDDGQGDLGGDVGDVLVDGDVADGAALGVDQVPAVPPPLRVRGPEAFGLGVAVQRPHQGDGLGMEELLQVAPTLGITLRCHRLSVLGGRCLGTGACLSRPGSRPTTPRSRGAT